MSLEGIQAMVVSAKLLFVWNQTVYGSMAVATDVNGLTHLLAREAFLEPLVGVTAAWNQVMGRGSTSGDAPTHRARLT
jgi:hypothetical protein